MASSDGAIKVNSISKRYRIGVKEEIHDTILLAILSFIRKPIRNFKKYRSLYRFGVDDESGITTTDGATDIIWALKDVSFEVKRGEVVGIIGGNGAGKSTLLKILSKITSPTTGYAEVRGRISSLLEVGTGFHPDLTGRENVYLNATILGMTKREVDSAFDKIVDFSGVEKFIDTPVKRFSSGMKVRLAFSVAAHLKAEILLIDEVLAVGDVTFQKKCLGKMETIANEGRTVLFVSHNMGAVRKLCSRALLFDKGTIIGDGEADATVTTYLENLNELMRIPLEGRSDRSGNGQLRILDIKVIDESRNIETTTIPSGSDVTFILFFDSSEDLKCSDLHIGLSITNSDDQLVTVLNNKLSNFHFKSINGFKTISCKIRKFPLMSGNFYLRASIIVDGTLSDRVEGAVEITVEESDFYGSGQTNVWGIQGVYIDQRWYMEV